MILSRTRPTRHPLICLSPSLHTIAEYHHKQLNHERVLNASVAMETQARTPGSHHHRNSLQTAFSVRSCCRVVALLTVSKTPCLWDFQAGDPATRWPPRLLSLPCSTSALLLLRWASRTYRSRTRSHPAALYRTAMRSPSRLRQTLELPPA